MTHYDRYPYPHPDTYIRNGKNIIRQVRTESAPRRDTWGAWFPGEVPALKNVLVLGCGTYEALIVAVQEPLLRVVGVDSSSASIDYARKLAYDERIDNVRLVVKDLFEYEPSERFDLVMASGLMHHIEDEDAFLRKVHSLLNPGGCFTAMVYGDRYRQFIPAFCAMLHELELKHNTRDIGFVRGLIKSLPPQHPVKLFQDQMDDSDPQIVDIWLHPFFRQYAADELLDLLESYDFTFQRWIYQQPTDYHLFENLPVEYADIMTRFAALPVPTKYRFGQLINHADLKLTAQFTRGD